MSNKRYSIRYTHKGGVVQTAFFNYESLMDILKGGAAGCIVEVKISSDIPEILYNEIEKHNQSIRHSKRR